MKQATRTICSYCGVGCALDLEVSDGKIQKAVAGDGASTHKQACIKGVSGWDYLYGENRLTVPLIRRDGRLQEATWEEALDLVAARLGAVRETCGGGALAVLGSAKVTNEENYLIQKFARAVLLTNNVDHCTRLCHAPSTVALGRALGFGALTNSYADIADAEVLLVMGSNTTEAHPIVSNPIRAARRKGAKLIVIDPRRIDLAKDADLYLQVRPGTDLWLLTAMARAIVEEGLENKGFIAGRTEEFELWKESLTTTIEAAAEVTGVPADQIRRAARLFAAAPAAMTFWAMGITQHVRGTETVHALINLTLLCGHVGRPGAGLMPLRGQNNVQGACDMGILPYELPGYQPIGSPQVRARYEQAWGRPLPAEAGLTVLEIGQAAGEGAVKAMYIIGENPVVSDPDTAQTIANLSNLEFLVVQDIFLTETAAMADVVLPAAAWAEKEGTFTNSERRIQRTGAAVPPAGLSRPDWQIITELSNRLGYPMEYPGTEAIMAEIARLVPIYAGVTYDRLDETGGLQWPVPAPDHPGTQVLYGESFPRGRGRFQTVRAGAHRPVVSEERPFQLITGRVLQHYNTGTMTRRSEPLMRKVPSAYVEMNPEDAATAGVTDGEWTEITTARGTVRFPVKVTERVGPGTLFVPIHFADLRANLLTSDERDPQAKIPQYKLSAAAISPALVPTIR